MHIVTIVDKGNLATDGRRQRADGVGVRDGPCLSVAERRNLFEQLTTASTKVNGAAILKNGAAQQQQMPPPKPARTFAHDQYLKLNGVNTASGAEAVATSATGTTSNGKNGKPVAEPNSRLCQKVKPPVVSRRQNRSKASTRAGVRGGPVQQGVSHEYEHLLAARSPMVLRQQQLRRSLSDDPVAYAESCQLRVITADIDVSPIYYASSPVPTSLGSAENGSVYDTPSSFSNSADLKPKARASKLRRRPRDSLLLNDRARNDDQSEDEETGGDVENGIGVKFSTATEKRINRAKLMRRRTLMHYDQQEIAFVKRQSPQLFEFAALVRLEPNDGSHPMLPRDQKYAPRVVYRYPPLARNREQDSGSLMASLSCLCYPDISKAVLSAPETYKDEQFVMTITDQFGDRKFAYCYRFVPVTRIADKLSPTGRAVRIISHHHAASSVSTDDDPVLRDLPQVLCILTPVQAPTFYTDLVREAALKAKHFRTDQSCDARDLRELNEFFKEAFNKPLPPPGGRLVLNGPWVKSVIITHRMSSSARGIANGLSHFVERIGIDNTMLLFMSLLSERRVLLVGESVPAVSKAVQAAVAFLVPFEWPHTLVPVVPDPYINLCFSPTPYLMGLLRSNLSYIKDLLVGRRKASAELDEDDEECLLILDLDYGIVKDKDFSDDCSAGSTTTTSVHRCLPLRTARILKHSLRHALASSASESSTTSNLADAKDAKVADAFLSSFVDLIGHYREFLVTQQDGHVTFQKQQFVNDAMTESQRSFLKWFVETGMFQVWLKKKLDLALTGPVGGSHAKSVTLGAISASDMFDRKLDQIKFRQAHGNAVYRVLLNNVIRKWSSFIRRTK